VAHVLIFTDARHNPGNQLSLCSATLRQIQAGQIDRLLGQERLDRKELARHARHSAIVDRKDEIELP